MKNATLLLICRRWMEFGRFLQRFTNPLVMGAVYFGCIVPLGLLMRLFGRDPLTRRFDAAKESYWADTPASTDMRLRF